MTQNEKRALEIYIALIIQYIRKENNKALEHLRAFFYGMSFMQNYNPEFLYQTCIANIEIIEKIPTHSEILIASTIRTKLVHFTFKAFKKYYKRSLTALQLKQQQFSEKQILLLPRIKEENFHPQLLTFLQNFAIISKNIPVKETAYVKRKNV